MKKTYMINLGKVETKKDLFKEIYHSCGDIQQEPENLSWDALNDNLWKFYFSEGESGITQVHFILDEWSKFADDNKEKKQLKVVLLEILTDNTNPDYRSDGLEFTFQARG